MENKQKAFLKKYFAEEDRQLQLNMLKDYMLSLSLEDLTAFTMEPLLFFEQALTSPAVSEELKNKIHNQLGEMAFLLKGEVVA